jgi:hypothetical protein
MCVAVAQVAVVAASAVHDDHGEMTFHLFCFVSCVYIKILTCFLPLAKDVHARLRTAAHQHVTGRFVERFILSLGSCPMCLVADEELNILPISSHIRNITALPPQGRFFRFVAPVLVLVGCCVR